mmetsp:Transcript_113352/g.366694  ORF Transcript_113352/g.366694 Transcript_113352/m.366694 type:complete len:643 (-) Transcript_113352:362-2290(-)
MLVLIGDVGFGLVPRGDSAEIPSPGLEAGAQHLGALGHEVRRHLHDDLIGQPRACLCNGGRQPLQIIRRIRGPSVAGAGPVRLHDALLDVPVPPLALGDAVQGFLEVALRLADAQEHARRKRYLQLPGQVELRPAEGRVLRGRPSGVGPLLRLVQPLAHLLQHEAHARVRGAQPPHLPPRERAHVGVRQEAHGLCQGADLQGQLQPGRAALGAGVHLAGQHQDLRNVSVPPPQCLEGRPDVLQAAPLGPRLPLRRPKVAVGAGVEALEGRDDRKGRRVRHERPLTATLLHASRRCQPGTPLGCHRCSSKGSKTPRGRCRTGGGGGRRCTSRRGGVDRRACEPKARRSLASSRDLGPEAPFVGRGEALVGAEAFVSAAPNLVALFSTDALALARAKQLGGEAPQHAVRGRALDGHAPRPASDLPELLGSQPLPMLAAGGCRDRLVDEGASQIVDSSMEQQLRHPGALLDPRGLDVVHSPVQHDPRHRMRQDHLDAARSRPATGQQPEAVHRRLGGDEGEGHELGEAAGPAASEGPSLHAPQQIKVRGDVLRGLHVAVHHRGGRRDALCMGSFDDFEPLLGGEPPSREPPPHVVVQDLRRGARQGVHPGGAQRSEHLRHRPLRRPGSVEHLLWRESVQVQVGHG